MTRSELLDLAVAFVNVKDLFGVKFAYAISKNSKNISGEVESCQESLKSSEKFLEYDKKRTDLCKQHCEKDKNGNPVIKNNNFVGINPGNNPSFDKEFELLKSEYAEVVAEREKAILDYGELLKEEVEIDLYKVKLEDVPENISVQQLHGIMAIVEE